MLKIRLKADCRQGFDFIFLSLIDSYTFSDSVHMALYQVVLKNIGASAKNDENPYMRNAKIFNIWPPSSTLRYSDIDTLIE